MKTIAVKIGLETGDLDRIFEVDSASFIERFSRTFWEMEDAEEVVIHNLYASTSEFKDVEFSEVYTKFFDNISDVERIFIEFGSPQYAGTISTRIFHALTNLVSFLRMKYGTSLKIVLAFPKKFSGSSTGAIYLVEHFSNEIKNASIYLFLEHEFVCTSVSSEKAEQVLSVLQDENAALFFTPSEKFGHNVVCHLGKFQTSASPKQIIYDFYDGSRASSEVYVILREIFQKAVAEKGDAELLLVYDRGGHFEWFGDALFTAEKNVVKDLKAKIRVSSATDYMQDDGNEFPDVLLFPVVRSGGTLRSITEGIRNKFPDRSLPELHCLIYANGTDQNIPLDVEFGIENGNSIASIKSSVQRGARGDFLREIWKDSNFPAQHQEDLLDYSLEFSAASMWGMLFETELGAENSSRKRKQISRFPDFSEIFERNQPLFVHKIKAIESDLGLTGRFKYIVPDEAVPLKVAETLCSESMETSIVAVPSKVLEVASAFVGAEWDDFAGAVTEEDFSSSILLQFSNLASLRRKILDDGGFDTTQKNYCVLDACRVTGKTMRGLEAIVGMLGGNVAATITLADFSHLSEFSRQESSYRSLYSFGG